MNEPGNETIGEPQHQSPQLTRPRLFWKLLLSSLLLIAIGLGVIAWYVTTDSFQRMARRRVIESLEKIVGGRVEMGELHTIPFRLRVDARNVTVHGREGEGQPPFFQVDRLQAEMKIISILSKTVGLRSLVLDHPVVHIVGYSDGTTNVPTPQMNLSPTQGPLEELLSMAVSRVEVQRGEVSWEDKKVPFDFAARNVVLGMKYSLLRRRYEAHLSVGSVATRVQAYPGFEWRADASLILARGRAEISKLSLFSGQSEIHFAGHLLDFHNPHVVGDYRGVADLGELGTLVRQREMHKGRVEFAGKGSWNLRDFATQGNVQAKDLEWSNNKLTIRNGRLNAAYSVTPERIRLTSVKANLLGGDLQGEADITNWQNSTDASQGARRGAKAGRATTTDAQRGSLRAQLNGFPIPPLTALLSSKSLPIDEVQLAGFSSGTIDMLWVGSIRDAQTRLNLEVTPPQKPAGTEVPVRGRVNGIYRGSRDELAFSELHLTTPGSDLMAEGNLSETSALRFSLASHNLRELMPLLKAAYGPGQLPFTVHGWASLTGNANGRLSAMSIDGNLEVYDFDAVIPAIHAAPSRSIHWDALASGLQYSSSHIAARNGSLIHGHTTAHFDVSAALVNNTFPEQAPFTLHIDLKNGDVAEIASLAGFSPPVAGAMNMTGSLSGTRANPHGDGHLEIHNVVAYGLNVPSIKSDLRLGGGELQANNMDASVFEAPLSGSAGISTTNPDFWKNDFHLNLSGRNIRLARFRRLHSNPLAPDGVADFTLRGGGNYERPSLEAHVHLKDLSFGQEPYGEFFVDAVTHDRMLDVTSHSAFTNATLSINGTMGLEHDFPADFTLAFSHLDADALLRIYLQGKITGHSALDGSLRVTGPLRKPHELKATAELQKFALDVGHVQIHTTEPIRLTVSDRVLQVKKLHLTGNDTDFTVRGSAHLGGSKELDLHLNGSVNVGLWQTFNPKILARGMVGVSLNASGTLAQPILQGRLEVKNTFVSHNDFPSGLSDLNGTLLFDRNRIQIERLSGTTGGGTLALTGSTTYQNGIFQFDLGATAQGVRLRYPPGVSSTANADLRLAGNTKAAVLSGDVVVTKLAVTPGFDFGAYIERSRQTVVLNEAESLQSHLRLDIHVVTTPELQMQTAIARLSGNADLRVRGTAQRPAILGRVEVLEGEVTFNGTKYKLERGDVSFANPAKTQPIIDMQATTRVRDYDITVQLRGDASVANGLKVTWQSEPQLPQADVIALLALGRTQEESAAAASNGSFGFGGDASNLLINQALNSAVNSRLQRLFGASRVKIDPQGLPSDTAVVRGPQVTVEQQVANNLTLTYSTNVAVANQQIIQVEYNITRNVSIVALRDWNGVVSFDFKIRRRKK